MAERRGDLVVNESRYLVDCINKKNTSQRCYKLGRSGIGPSDILEHHGEVRDSERSLASERLNASRYYIT